MLEVVVVVRNTIRDLGAVPSGELYAHLMGYMSLETYESIIQLLLDAGVVTSSNHVITWMGE